MIHVLRLFALSTVTLSFLASSADAQPRNANKKGQPVDPLQQMIPLAPPIPPGGNQFEEDVPDLRGWLDGSIRNLGKNNGLDPKTLADLLSKMKQGKEGLNAGDPAALDNLIKNNPAFKNPEFLKSLEKMMGDKSFPNNFKDQLKAAGQDPKSIDKVPDFKEKLGTIIDKAKQQTQQNTNNQNNVDQNNQANNNGNGNNNNDGQNNNNVANPNPNIPPGFDTPPNLDPNTLEWVKWMERNFGNSPTGQQAIKEMVDAMQKGNLKGMLDDLPQFKNGEWKQFNEWGKSNFGENWLKSSPPSWNINWGNGGGSSFSGPNFNFGGSSAIGGIGSIGAGGASAGAGGVSILAIIIGCIGAAFILYILFQKWKKDQELKLALEEAARKRFELSRIQNREELVEAFDTLTVVKLGDVSRNWNHRVVTQSFAETLQSSSEPAEELGELYARARYSPPQDDLTPIELNKAEQDLRVVAGGGNS